LPNIHSIFGFGSFFHSNIYNDIDILFVLWQFKSIENSILLSKEIREICKKFENRIEIPIDVLILTYDEFLERPLKHMDKLILLSMNDIS